MKQAKEINGYIPQFKIYKEGRTSRQITIFEATGYPFDRKEKINKYLYLGYKVYELDGTEIKSV